MPVGVDGSHHSLFHQAKKRVVQGVHPLAPSALDHVDEIVRLAFANQVADGGIADQDLGRRNAARLVRAGQQNLRDDSRERLREHGAYPWLLRRVKHVDDAIDGVGRAVGMERCEHESTDLRRGQSQADGLEVAHLAHQNNIRIFPQGRDDAGLEVDDVIVETALMDNGLLARVDVLDRIFQSDHMLAIGVVDEIDDGRQRGGLSRTRSARDQGQPASQVGERFDFPGKIELAQGGNDGRDLPEYRGGTPVILEVVAAVADAVHIPVGEVELPGHGALRLLLAGQDFHDHAIDVSPAEHIGLRLLELAVQAVTRSGSRLQVKIGSVDGEHVVQIGVEFGHGGDLFKRGKGIVLFEWLARWLPRRSPSSGPRASSASRP